MTPSKSCPSWGQFPLLRGRAEPGGNTQALWLGQVKAESPCTLWAPEGACLPQAVHTALHNLLVGPLSAPSFRPSHGGSLWVCDSQTTSRVHLPTHLPTHRCVFSA